MLAWAIEATIRCRDCGTYPDEWNNDIEAYHVDPYRCVGCEALEVERDSFARDEASTFGIKFRLKKAD